MKLINGPFPALFIAVLFCRLDKVLAQAEGFEGSVYGGQYGESSKETGDNKSQKFPHYEGPYMGGSRQRGNSGETRNDIDRKDSSRGGSHKEELKKTGDNKSRKVPHYEGPYMGGSRQRENSGETNDDKERKESSRGGPYRGIYDKTKDGRNEDKVDKGDAHKGSYGTYSAYGGSVPTEDLTKQPIQRRRKYPTSKLTSQPRSYPTLEPTQRPFLEASSFPTANEFDASESTFLGGYSIPKEDTPYTPEYVSPYAQYIPPTKETPYVPKKGIPSFDQKIPQYVPRYTPPADDVSGKRPPFFFCCQCYPPPPPPPPRCTPYCQGPSSYSAPGSYQTSGSYQQPHQGCGMCY
jgi:hypothetical protein